MDAHPICALLPEMTNDEYAALVSSIKRNGLINPITTLDGKILDGRHRFKACADAGEPPRFKEYDGDDPVGFVQATCTHRNLSVSQRALIAASFLEYERDQAKMRQQANLKHGGNAPVVENLPQREAGKSRDKAGARMGVSGKSVAAAEEVLTKAAPKVVQMVRSGEMTVHEASHVAKLNKRAQERIAEAPKHQRADELRVAQNRSESCKRRDNPTATVQQPGTPFVRKFLGGLERMAMICAEDGSKDGGSIAGRFALEMDWSSQPLLLQLERCEPIIEAVEILRKKIAATKAA